MQNKLSRNTAIYRWFLVLGVVLTCLLHAPFLNRPPESAHVWRQSITLAVARNFYQEEMTLFRPRVDNRFDTDGVTGSHFPIYEFLLASAYHLFGEQFWVHRCFSLLLYILGAFGMYALVFAFWQNRLASGFAFWAWLWSPELFYHGINALPDILALTASIWGLYFFIKWFYHQLGQHPIKQPFVYYTLGLGLITLAGLTKIQYLAVGFPIAGLVLLHGRKLKNLLHWIWLAIFAVTSVGLTLGWYAYAVELIQTSGLAEVGLEFRPAGNWMQVWYILQKNLTSDLLELLMNYACSLVFLVGCFFVFQRRTWRRAAILPFLIWGLGLLAYHIIELSQMEHHAYYMMPHIPLLLIIAAYGAKHWWAGRLKWLLLFLIIAQPALASLRILPARWMKEDKGVPQELYRADSRQRLIDAVPNDSLCIVGVDASNIIYFYFLHKKGFGIPFANRLTEPFYPKSITIASYIQRGATHMYLDDKQLLNDPRIRPYIDEVLLEEGDFTVVTLVSEQ